MASHDRSGSFISTYSNPPIELWRVIKKGTSLLLSGSANDEQIDCIDICPLLDIQSSISVELIKVGYAMDYFTGRYVGIVLVLHLLILFIFYRQFRYFVILHNVNNLFIWNVLYYNNGLYLLKKLGSNGKKIENYHVEIVDGPLIQIIELPIDSTGYLYTLYFTSSQKSIHPIVHIDSFIIPQQSQYLSTEIFDGNIHNLFISHDSNFEKKEEYLDDNCLDIKFIETLDSDIHLDCFEKIQNSNLLFQIISNPIIHFEDNIEENNLELWKYLPTCYAPIITCIGGSISNSKDMLYFGTSYKQIIAIKDNCILFSTSISAVPSSMYVRKILVLRNYYFFTYI